MTERVSRFEFQIPLFLPFVQKRDETAIFADCGP
jgi:hypothetical protein